jgi:hypothetical protein
VGSFVCHFCLADETISQLFLTCLMVAYMWSIISTVLGVYTKPSYLTHYFWWIEKIALICM